MPLWKKARLGYQRTLGARDRHPHWPKPRAGSVSRAAAKRQRAVEPGAANAARARLAVNIVRWTTAVSRGG
jgi:hypothetical protein